MYGTSRSYRFSFRLAPIFCCCAENFETSWRSLNLNRWRICSKAWRENERARDAGIAARNGQLLLRFGRCSGDQRPTLTGATRIVPLDDVCAGRSRSIVHIGEKAAVEVDDLKGSISGVHQTPLLI